MKKSIIVIVLCLLSINFVAAENANGGIVLNMTNNVLTIGDYIQLFGTSLNNSNLILDSETITLTNPIVCPTVVNYTDNFNISRSYNTDCYSNLSFYLRKPLKREYMNSTGNCTNVNYELVNTETQAKLNTCLADKSMVETNHRVVTAAYAEANKTNDLYVQCNANLAVCNNEKNPLQTEISALKKEKEDTKNSPATWGIIGLILGAGLAYGLVSGKIGGTKIKNPEANYNRGEAA